MRKLLLLGALLTFMVSFSSNLSAQTIQENAVVFLPIDGNTLASPKFAKKVNQSPRAITASQKTPTHLQNSNISFQKRTAGILKNEAQSNTNKESQFVVQTSKQVSNTPKNPNLCILNKLKADMQ